jgi:hypothetical protein
MHRINKIDYFIGVFLTTILNSSNGVPALFDATDNSKKIEFTTDIGEYNVYIKYSTKLKKTKKNIKGKMKNKVYCNVSFSDNDFNFLKNDFYKTGNQNLVCLVCTNDKLNETYMAVILYEDAMKCLREKTESGSRRITITRTGAEYDFYCYGVGFRDYEYIKAPVDCTKFLGLREDENPYKQLSMI